jgi:hypothetical protein
MGYFRVDTLCYTRQDPVEFVYRLGEATFAFRVLMIGKAIFWAVTGSGPNRFFIRWCRPPQSGVEAGFVSAKPLTARRT